MRAPLRILCSAIVFSATFSAATVADEESHGNKAVDYRESVMSILKWNMGPLGAMASGKMAYDEALFRKHAGDLIAASRLDLLAGFPEDSDTGEGAKSEIWLDWENFVAKHEAFRNATSGLEQAVAGGKEETMKAALGEVGKACKGCHKSFKE